jgi:hypothetical protein
MEDLKDFIFGSTLNSVECLSANKEILMENLFTALLQSEQVGKLK